MGADVIIAINVGTPVLTRKQIQSALDISLQSILVLSEENVSRSIQSLGEDDILITPDLGTIGSADFQRTPEAIPVGEAAARASAERLASLSAPEDAFAEYLRRQRTEGHRPTIVDNIQVIGTRNVSPEAILERLHTRPGDTLDVESLRRDLSSLYELGDFERVEFGLVRVQDKNLLMIRTTEKSWGPNYLRFGIGFSDDFAGDTRFELTAGLTQTWINSLGAQWKHKIRVGSSTSYRTEFHQPLESTQTLFVAPKAVFERRIEDVFDGSRRVGQYQVDVYAAVLDAGVQLGRFGELRAGYERGIAYPEMRIGDVPRWNSDAVHWGAISIQATGDQLDDMSFPRSGARNQTRLLISSPRFGGDSTYVKLTVSGRRAVTHRGITMLLMGDVGLPLHGDIPKYDLIPIGGFLNLSGYGTNRFVGRYMGLARAVFYRPVSHHPGTVYFGASAETGNAWDHADDIRLSSLVVAGSAFVGVDTPIGPLFLAVGLGHPLDEPIDRTWNWRLYMKLGRVLETGRTYFE